MPYPNLFPNDPWSAKPRFRLAQAGDRWKTVATNGSARTARGLFLYVVQGGEVWVGKVVSVRDSRDRLGHIDLARGNAVEYAGEIRFRSGYNRRGILIAWNSESGHDLPDLADRWVVPLLPQFQFARPIS